MKKVYKLTIVYDTEKEVIEFFEENTLKDKPSFTIGEVDISELYDEETLELIDKSYVLAES